MSAQRRAKSLPNAAEESNFAMLYRPAPLDFERQILVFLHIPKTAGSALDEALKQGLGEENCLLTRAENIGQIFPDRFRKAHWRVRKFLREGRFRLRGRDILLPEDVSPEALGRFRLLDGHFSLGKEPKTGREPVYITLIRDPIERFLSDYYYRFEWAQDKQERHAFRRFEVDHFVDYVYPRRAWSELNLQCRYLARRGNFNAARESVDRRVFLAAPSNRIDDCLGLLRPVLNLGKVQAPRSNVGRIRQIRAQPSPGAVAKIREMVAEDIRLYDYVSTAFDQLVRAV
ncbi:MAG: hypothetical protein E7774_03705 [Bradyrhizobium sp.]|nr:MAG: hypothetical protein E7774_03705 [Bradyrhizobium sp.]